MMYLNPEARGSELAEAIAAELEGLVTATKGKFEYFRAGPMHSLYQQDAKSYNLNPSEPAFTTNISIEPGVKGAYPLFSEPQGFYRVLTAGICIDYNNQPRICVMQNNVFFDELGNEPFGKISEVSPETKFSISDFVHAVTDDIPLGRLAERTTDRPRVRWLKDLAGIDKIDDLPLALSEASNALRKLGEQRGFLDMSYLPIQEPPATFKDHNTVEGFDEPVSSLTSISRVRLLDRPAPR